MFFFYFVCHGSADKPLRAGVDAVLVYSYTNCHKNKSTAFLWCTVYPVLSQQANWNCCILNIVHGKKICMDVFEITNQHTRITQNYLKYTTCHTTLVQWLRQNHGTIHKIIKNCQLISNIQIHVIYTYISMYKLLIIHLVIIIKQLKIVEY